MPSPKMTQDCWNEVKLAYEQGVDDQSLSADFGVSREAIRQRRARDGKAGRPWLSPAAIKAEMQKAEIDRKFRTANNQTAVVTNVTAGVSAAQKWLADGEIAQQHAMKILLGKLSRAALDPDSVEDISTVQDTVTALKGARLIAGLDKEGQNVVLNLGAFWSDPGAGAVESPVVVEVEE